MMALMFKFFLTALFSIGILSTIESIGKDRKRITHGIAAWSAVLTGLTIWGIWGLL